MKSKIKAKEWHDLGLTYEEAMHGMQSAVAHERSLYNTHKLHEEGKHLRVGINSALLAQGALTNLLIKKGLFTEEEYFEELRLAANQELSTYQDRYYGITFR